MWCSSIHILHTKSTNGNRAKYFSGIWHLHIWRHTIFMPNTKLQCDQNHEGKQLQTQQITYLLKPEIASSNFTSELSQYKWSNTVSHSTSYKTHENKCSTHNQLWIQSQTHTMITTSVALNHKVILRTPSLLLLCDAKCILGHFAGSNLQVWTSGNLCPQLLRCKYLELNLCWGKASKDAE